MGRTRLLSVVIGVPGIVFLLVGTMGCGSAQSAMAQGKALGMQTTGAKADALDDIATNKAWLEKLGYKPRSMATSPTDSGRTFYAWEAACPGSADGHCWKLFFFYGTQLKDAGSVSSSLPARLSSAGMNRIQAVFTTYSNTDPLCCPSGPQVPVTYTYTKAGSITASNPIPGSI